MTNTIAPADIETLRAIATGDRIHHMRRKRLVNLGLVTSAGDLTRAGAEAIAPEQAPAAKPAKRRSKQARPCACGCEAMTGGGTWAPGHDARWAGITARRIVEQAPMTAGDGYWDREVTREAEQVGASAALAAKVLKMVARLSPAA